MDGFVREVGVFSFFILVSAYGICYNETTKKKEGIAMKKICALIVLLVFCLALGGCGKSEAVKNVEAMIAGIDTVSDDNLEAVYAALGPMTS